MREGQNNSPVATATEVVGLLRGLVGSCAGLGPNGLDAMVAALREAQNATGALLLDAGKRAAELLDAGEGRPVVDVLRGGDRVPVGVARQEAKRVKAAARMPVLANAVAGGVMNVDELDAVTAATEDLDDEQLAKYDQAEVANLAGGVSWWMFGRLVRGKARTARGETREEQAKKSKDRSKAKLWWDELEQLGHLHVQLDGERFAAIQTVIDQMIRALANAAEGGNTKDAKLAAEAVYQLLIGGGARNTSLPHIVVVVDAETAVNGEHEGTTSETSDGYPVPVSAIDRMACHATIRRVTLDENGVAINVGRAARTATDAQWDAARSMYRTCGWPDCSVPLSHCQLHHIRYWRNGGRTDLHNLLPLCTAHHDQVHSKNWQVVLHKDRSLEILKPDGTRIAGTPPPNRLQKQNGRKTPTEEDHELAA